MRILVTGGAGYIGSTVVHHLLRNGHEVRVVDLLVGGGQSLITACRDSRFEILVGDIRDRQVAANAVAGCEAILHLAAVVGTPACERMPEVARTTNVGATETLLATREAGQRLVFASTGGVYGEISSGYCDEDTSPEPTTLYGLTKFQAEGMVRDARNAFVMRLGTVFGVSRALRWDLLVNSLTLQAVNDRTVTVYQPHARRSFIHVDDVSRALCLPVLEWGDVRERVFNVGDVKLDMEKGQLARIICHETGALLAINAIGEDPDRRDYTISFNKIAELGFHANRSLSTGIKELAKAAVLCNRHTR